MSDQQDSFASIILFTADGRCVLQLRDDIPSIVDPNLLSLFAGRVKAIAELTEENTARITYDILMRYAADNTREA